ncbi:MAG: phosphoribosylanthranilate isomerase [Gammaproteobacteria bacterium]|nr:phosphoribosylanthranilate isomerase [Gammaproteobacteria bacterium]
MTRTRIKICGITRLEDALKAIELGVDALGFVFVKSSPRYISAQDAKAIINQLPPFAQTVGLFMNQPCEEVQGIVRETALNLLQFHGDESVSFCKQFDTPYIKAIPMGGGVNPVEYAALYSTAVGFLLDSHQKGASGGSGDKFDWESIPAGFSKPLILAGGLTVDNVESAVKQVRPYAVDVSSGVEAEKGVKAADKMKKFVRGVNLGDN